MKDIGFETWLGAFAAMVVCGALAYASGAIHPVVQAFIVIAFELLLLFVPTGANCRNIP